MCFFNSWLFYKHRINSTAGGGVRCEYKEIGDIHIGKHCFIGIGTTILPGTTIGNYSIIGAGSVVKGDIPEHSVVIGNPARILKTTEEYTEKKIRQYQSLGIDILKAVR